MTKQIKTHLLLAITLLVKSGYSLTLQYHEINRSILCDSAPTVSVIKACKDHKGANSPFRYVAIHSFNECEAINDTSIKSECRSKPFGSTFYTQTTNISNNVSLSRDSAETKAANDKYARSAAIVAAPYIAVVACGIIIISFVYWQSNGHINLNPLNN